MRTSNIERRTSNVEVKTKPSAFATSTFSVRRSTFDVRILFSFLLLTTPAFSATTGPTTSVTQPTADNLQLVEWAVFVVDASANQMNPQGYVTSTLPGFVTDHRFSFGPIKPIVPTNPNGNMFFNGRFWVQLNPAPTESSDTNPKLADSDQPSPVGVIRLIGSADSKVDVSISSKDGSFLGSWPKAEERDKQLLWRDLSISAKPSDDPQLVAPTHWFNALRSVDSAYLSLAHGGADRFLLYDLEQPYTSPLKVKATGDFKFEVSNQTGSPLHDLTLYQANRSVRVGEVPPSAHPVMNRPIARVDLLAARLGIKVSPVSADRDRARNFSYQQNTGLFIDEILPSGAASNKLRSTDILVNVDGYPLNSADDLTAHLSGEKVKFLLSRGGHLAYLTVPLAPLPAQEQEGKTAATTMPIATTAPTPTTGPTTAAAPTTASTAMAKTTPAATTQADTAYQLIAAPTTQPTDLADSWKPTITGAGIDPADAAIIMRVISKYAFDPHRLTAVYRMDNAEMDRMLPIEVVPQPAKISRFAVVIVINADPGAGTIVDDLIKQLGDEDWTRRDAAYNALASMGPAAQAKLNAAKNNTDLEIAWRAERLLALLPGGAK
jgi:hypothetical protein